MLCFVIYGEAASKANARELVHFGDKPALIKSKKARRFMESARRQVPPKMRLRLDEPVRVTLHMHYATERPDLDESVVLDALQDLWKSWRTADGELHRTLLQAGVYVNDRLVREKHVYHHIDRTVPRVEVQVELLGQQSLLAC